MLHGVAAIVSFTFVVAACLAFAFRFAGLGQWRWVIFTAASGVISFVLPSVPNPWGGVFIFVAAAIGWGGF